MIDAREEIKRITKIKGIEKTIEVPPDSSLGDYASTVCFELAKEKKKTPKLIADELAKSISIPKGSFIKSAESKGGYINFFLDYDKFSADVINDTVGNDRYGSSKIGSGKKIVIDYSSPNLAKPMHVGHIRSTILGDTLIKIFQFLGYDTIGFNYPGDSGPQVGKVIVALSLWGNAKNIKNEKDLLKLYVRFHKEAENNPELEKQAQQIVEDIERGDKKIISKIEEVRKISWNGFEKIYELLDVHFDDVRGESYFVDSAREMIKRCLENRIAFIDEDKRVVIDLEKYGLQNTVLERSNKTTMYISRDLGLAEYKYRKYKFFKSIYITGSEQNLHFKQLFKILELLGFKYYRDCVHLPFGLLTLEEGKMSTREGVVVFLEDVLNKAIELSMEEVRKRNTELNEKEIRKIAEKVGIGAVKYAILKIDADKNIMFSWKETLSFEGNSGPYLQYTHARANRILEKSKYKPKKIKSGYRPNNTERELVKHISLFPDTVVNAAENLNPQVICNYVYKLAMLFNKFYQECPVIRAGKDSKDFRLALTKSSVTVMKNSLQLIGMHPVERM